VEGGRGGRKKENESGKIRNETTEPKWRGGGGGGGGRAAERRRGALPPRLGVWSGPRWKVTGGAPSEADSCGAGTLFGG